MVEVAIDVGMVELDRGQDRAVRPVVEKLRPLVEKRGVVLVALDHEVATRAEPVVGAEVLGHPADQHRGVAPGGVEHLRHHRGRGRLAMRPGDHQHALRAEEEMPQRLGHREIRQPAFEERLRLRIGARDDVADHDQVGRGREVLRAETLLHLDAHLFKQRRRRFVELVVGTGDTIATLGQHPGQRRHRGARDADQMDMADVVRHPHHPRRRLGRDCVRH